MKLKIILKHKTIKSLCGMLFFLILAFALFSVLQIQFDFKQKAQVFKRVVDASRQSLVSEILMKQNFALNMRVDRFATRVNNGSDSIVSLFDENGHVLFSQKDKQSKLTSALLSKVSKSKKEIVSFDWASGDLLICIPVIFDSRIVGIVTLQNNIRTKIVSTLLSLIGFLLSVLVLIVVYNLVQQRVLQNQIIMPLEKIRTSLDQIDFEKFDGLHSETEVADEIDAIIQHFNLAMKRLSETNEVKVENKRLLAVQDVSQQVAHDIRSPVAALLAITNYLPELPEEKRVLIRSAVQRINDIANDLSSKKSSSEIKTADKTKSVQLLASVIETLVSEKRMQFRSRQNLIITSYTEQSPHGLFAKVHLNEFKRVLSNLINNSAEALEHQSNGRVDLYLDLNDQGLIEIKIADNGKGIPQKVLSQLFQRGKSFGKESQKNSGSGLGLYHALNCIKDHGGDINISSVEKEGTQICITLPREKSPAWFLPEILFTSDHSFVILDDDDSIHRVWESRLTSLGVSKDKITHYTSVQSYLNQASLERSRPNKTINLFDYEILNEDKTGLDMIEQEILNYNQSGVREFILVTSHFEEDPIQSRCERLRVKLLPKNLAGFVPIRFDKSKEIQESLPTSVNNEESYVLIDDNQTIRDSWQMICSIENKNLKTFSSEKDFYAVIETISKETVIYIDSELANGVRGEEVAKDLYDRFGFKRIYMSTGHNPDKFKDMPWILGVVDKVPHFLMNQ